MRRPTRLSALLLLTLTLSACSSLPLWMVVQGKAEITDHRHFVNAPITRAAVPSPLPSPAQPVALRWPGGLTPDAAAEQLAARDTVALLVLRRGELVHEQYFNGFSRDTLGTSFSVAKSVVSLLVGVAVADGRIHHVDDPVTRYLPELQAQDTRFGQITLRHLLAMRSGIDFDEAYTVPWSQAATFYLGPDMKAQVARLRIRTAPDQAYSYQSGDTQLLAMALERAVGMPLANYLQQRLWQPMGAEFDASWSLDSAAGGVARAFCCLNARAVDYLRLGQAVLNGGRAASGAPLVSADWLRQSTAVQQRPGVDAAAQRNIERPASRFQAFYAWQWRRALSPAQTAAGQAAAARQPGASAWPSATQAEPGDDVYAEGLRGQYIYIAPGTQTVIVRLGRERGGLFWPAWLGELARLNP
ncbi:MAG: beta-lactamase family protein [Rubrivivax sp.]|nr:beta-lactamase family protein [Rubrivivax sp.]